MDERDFVYAARLFDGEGSVSLVKHRTTRWHSLQVSVASTDYEIYEWFQTRFGGSIVTKQPRRPNRSPSWDWRLANAGLSIFCSTTTFAVRPAMGATPKRRLSKRKR